jgi:hypothetical protein
LPRQLKVYRTAVGFRDAYVAAPSRAAALRAWGTGKDLFARGAAEEVTDTALTGEALSKPGEVVYRTRGGLEEQVAALGALPARGARRAESDRTEPPKRKQAAPRPRPSRADLEAADAKIADLLHEQEQAEAALRQRERALAAERKKIEERCARQLEALQDKQKKARRDYEAALRKWEP